MRSCKFHVMSLLAQLVAKCELKFMPPPDDEGDDDVGAVIKRLASEEQGGGYAVQPAEKGRQKAPLDRDEEVNLTADGMACTGLTHGARGSRAAPELLQERSRR